MNTLENPMLLFYINPFGVPKEIIFEREERMNEGQVVVAKESQIQSAVDNLSHEIDVLSATVETLIKRTEQIQAVVPSGERPSENTSKPLPTCPLANTIYVRADFVHNQILKLQSLLDRIEL